jgi:virginiamycin A acetyltransferase
MKKHMLSKLFIKFYNLHSRIIRNNIIRIVLKLEGGECYSSTLREIFLKYYGVNIGPYSHGGCFKPFQFGRETTIGRYCSFAHTARVMNRNHPLKYCSTHALFFNPVLKYVKEDKIEHVPIVIGSDVWIGHNAIIMPNVKTIGHGAVLAAGAVVNKDVPPYAVMVGNPARVVRFRFDPEVIENLLESKWWEKDIEELDKELMSKPFTMLDK